MASKILPRCLTARCVPLQPVCPLVKPLKIHHGSAAAVRSTCSSLHECQIANKRQSSRSRKGYMLTAAIGGAAAAGALTGVVSCETRSEAKLEFITLRDGRRLSYCVHGQGVPVFVLHGMESSRNTFDTMHWGGPGRPVSEVYPGMQVIAMDRPGYGDSTSPPRGYTYLDFVGDLIELADKLQLKQFCVAGHSSGGPYALAAAALHPDRVVSCAAISSDAPYAHPKADAEFKKSGDMPADALVRSGYYGGVASDRLQYRQGPLGYVCDYVLERVEWPFALEKISLGPRLTVWYGSEDVDCIIRSAKFLEELIPNAQVRMQKRTHGFKKDLDGQLNYKHLAEVFDELRTHWAKSAGK